ncbi:MAG: long-chain fatty acid--CoA ligase [Deltaproteobacteria bacterium]|nr:long-chain fatty acid--CoA ligase [Deltaproteobacteria bacterium]
MYPGDWTERLALLFADREAIVDVDDQGAVRRRISYAELRSMVAATSNALLELGVKPGARVAILSKNRVEHLTLLFACARIGALFLPINWRLAGPEVGYILSDATPTVLVREAAFAAIAQELPEGCNDVDVDAFAVLVERCRRQAAPPQAPVQIDDAWIILYTSGTTGNPKGALLPYRQVAFNALNTIVALDLSSSDKTVTYTPLFHTGGLHVLTTPLLMNGGAIVLCDGFDPARVLALTSSERCTILFGVPTTFERMADTELFRSGQLDVRVALCGGAPCPKSLIEVWNGKGVVFKQGYGLTECGPNVLNLNAEDVVRKAGSAGRPNLSITAVVVDEDGAVIRGAGRGELCLGGPCVCLGYWNKPDQTAASFTKDGLFKTGDVVEVDDEGYMTIVDRKKDMFISGGENVYPAEVEKVLSDHPRLRAAAVIGIQSAQWGEVGRAYVESKDGRSVDADDVLAFARARLARYKVPKEIVVVDALPRNPSGKVQKHLLPR